MDCARSESIFCWPRNRADFFREERFPAVDARVIRADFGVLADGCLRVEAVAAELFAEASSVELWRAFAKGTHAHVKISAPTALNALNRALRILAVTIKSATFTPERLQNQKPAGKRKSPTGNGHCNHPRSESTVPVPVGLGHVTEVYRVGTPFRLAATNPAAEPGKQHPARSLG